MIGFIGLIIALIYAAVYLYSKYKKQELDSKVAAGAFIPGNKGAIIDFAERISYKFILGGSLAAIAFAQGQDYGAYTTIVLMLLDIIETKVSQLGDK